MIPLDWNRRVFLKASSVAASAIPLIGSGLAAGREDASFNNVAIFAKHLQHLDFNQLTDFCHEIEVDGIEATIRKGGQIEPRLVSEELPRLTDTLMNKQKVVVIMTTDINNVGSENAELVLQTGSRLGIRYYRMAYYKYDLERKILPQLDLFAKQARELAELNKSLGLTGLYQNHSGANYVGAPLWDLGVMLREIESAYLSVAYDVRHATVEGFQSWEIDLNMLVDSIGATFVKDCKILDRKVEDVPLGTGDVSQKLFARLKRNPLPGPISLHMEYTDHKDPASLPAAMDAYRRDRATLRELLGV
ncbi:sugar phosphate isomerase/epimerase family protein [Pirellulaceae bacterium SH449]